MSDIILPLKLFSSFGEKRKQFLYGDSQIEFDDMTSQTTNWQHLINTVGGFESASFVINDNIENLFVLFNNLLLRHIRKENPESLLIWEGFINKITLTYGRMSLVKSLDNLYNRVYIRYAPKINDQTTQPPTIVYFWDDDSIDDWGYKEILINGGERWDDDIFYWGDTLVNELAKTRGKIPAQQTIPPASQEPQITVECKGLWWLLKWVLYSTPITSFRRYDQIVTDILTVFSNLNQNWISTDYTFIETNNARTKEQWNDMPRCQDALRSIINRGSQDGLRYVGGFYEDRQFHYGPANTVNTNLLYNRGPKYLTDIFDRSQKIYNEYTGSEIKPWDLRPDNLIIKLNDIYDIEPLYIEGVTFTEPYTYQIIGGDDNRLSVLLSQRGLPNF